MNDPSRPNYTVTGTLATGVGVGADVHIQCRAEVERLRAELDWHEKHRAESAVAQWKRMYETQQVEVKRLRAALARLIDLGEDDGSAPDDAWKQAWREAALALDSSKPD